MSLPNTNYWGPCQWATLLNGPGSCLWGPLSSPSPPSSPVQTCYPFNPPPTPAHHTTDPVCWCEHHPSHPSQFGLGLSGLLPSEELDEFHLNSSTNILLKTWLGYYVIITTEGTLGLKKCAQNTVQWTSPALSVKGISFSLHRTKLTQWFLNFSLLSSSQGCPVLSAERNQQDSDTSGLVGTVVPHRCSTTAGANSFLPITVVYRQGVNLWVNMNFLGWIYIYSHSLKQSLELSYTPTT